MIDRQAVASFSVDLLLVLVQTLRWLLAIPEVVETMSYSITNLKATQNASGKSESKK